ncbi:DUF6115 domain-containing protein [Hydrogenimonas sp.]
MNETLWIVAILAGVMLIIILYVAVRDRETSRKLAMMEAGIDGVNREVFKLSKAIERVEKRVLQECRELMQDRGEAEPVEKIVHKKLRPFVLELEHLQERVEELRQFQERLDRLDTKVRQVTFVNEHSAPDEQKILQLHAQGMDTESIAKQLRLGKGEVELVLKFSKFNPPS